MWSTGINRNIVECKVSFIEPREEGFLWVLIETLWNVKPDDTFSLMLEICINRNIVECKVGMLSAACDVTDEY